MSSYLQGVGELTLKLKKLGGLEDGKIIAKVVRRAIRPAEARARALIPVGKVSHRTYKGKMVQPGFAKKSVRSIVFLSKDKKTASAILGVRKEAFYAVNFVEIGTAKMAAQPWLRPAFRQTRAQQEAELRAGLKQFVESVAPK